MCAVGYNPKKCRALDSVGKLEVAMFGVPTSVASPGEVHPMQLIQGVSRRFAKLGPRMDRKAVYLDAAREIVAKTTEFLGTAQKPIMLSFDSEVYASFIPELMSADELSTFKNTWIVRGIQPVEISAKKAAGAWHYDVARKNSS